jgi:hypothetical protein
MDKKLSLILALILLGSMASAYDPTRNLNLKWRNSLPYGGRSVAVADVDGDGIPEIIAGLYNNTIFVLGTDGRLKFNYSLQNNTQIGRIYSMEAADFNGDKKAEMVVGLGGLRVSETFQLTGFIAPNATEDRDGTGQIQWTRVLYRSLRYMGNVYLLDNTGGLIWNSSTYNSVLSLNLGDVDGNGVVDILTGIGDYGVDVYSEIMGVNYTNKTCTSEVVKEEPTGYDIDKCTCDGCVWHPDTEECLKTYSKTTCVDSVKTIEGRVLVEYPQKNGSVIIYNRGGDVIWRKDIFKYADINNQRLDPDADNNVRVVYAADVNLDGINEILVGSDNGLLYLFNRSGRLLWRHNNTAGVVAVSVASFSKPKEKNIVVGFNDGSIEFLNAKGEIQWKAKIKKSVEAMDISDLDSDGEQEIIVGSVDNNIYIYDETGVNEWYYPVGAPVYYLKPLDVDGNGYMELVIGSPNNLTLYEMNVEYVLGQSADSFYDKASRYFSLSDYTMSMIYAKKARDIYMEINNAEGITRCDVLIKKLNDEFKTLKKMDADSQYERAIAAYGRNDINTSLVFLEGARRIYAELLDTVGINKCETLKQEIERFLVAEKSIIAEYHYVQGLNYLSFRNYTAAVGEARLARDLYYDIGYYNGTLLANRLITGIADNYYTDSKVQLSLGKFNISLAYAQMSLALYNESKTYDGTAKSELLIQDIKRKMAEGQAGPSNAPYNIVFYVLAVVVVIAVVMHLRRKKKGQ